MSSAIIVIVVVVVVVALWLVSLYNSLVKMRETVNNAFKRINIVLKKRADLFGNLLETVKGYKGLEEKYIDAFAVARGATLQSAKAPTAENQRIARATLGDALQGMRVINEQYPELKSIQLFANFSNDIRAQESDLESARAFYNGAVEEYNVKTKVFPTILFAKTFGFGEIDYWGNEEEQAELDKGLNTTNIQVKF